MGGESGESLTANSRVVKTRRLCSTSWKVRIDIGGVTLTHSSCQMGGHTHITKRKTTDYIGVVLFLYSPVDKGS